MDSKLAFLFPGQGSQFVGMGADLAAAYPEAAQTLAQADEALGLALSGVMREGPAEALTATEVAQPALLTHSTAVLRVLQAAGIAPDVVAGHSLGEYSALVAAGSLELAAAMAVVRERGLAMAAAGQEVGGAMAAVLGLEDTVVEEVVARAGQEGVVVVANYNGPGQVVVSGEKPAVERAGQLAKEAGARAVMPLQVSGAFHSPLMQPAADRLQRALEQAPLREARVPVVSNVDAQARTAESDMRAALQRQLTSSVRWTQTIGGMIAAGVETFVEVGPGEVLTKLMKRTAPQAWAMSTSTAPGVDAVLEALGA